MQALIPIAILSSVVGLSEGLNVYKGPLFSLYLRKFNRRLESYFVPLVTVVTSLWVLVFNGARISPIGLGTIVIVCYLLRVLIRRHYQGGFSPRLYTVLKWSLFNSVLNMDFLFPFLLLTVNVFVFAIFSISLVSSKLILSSMDELKLRRLALVNMELITVILAILSCFFLMLLSLT
ncbi:hypothetical protein [Sulfuracidifex metallicus]|uniref:hypothetical protein n=1 Tax=Sulfuracidifex metallicus TaxID=47303 RepID=UPI002272AA9A|nr:hypothetical protein [Sulfuracidifex metallicus]MCY0849714.1 hypothetical protein [Sulfuracidifex metallicus]